MRNYKAKSVGYYINSSRVEARPRLRELRRVIRSSIHNVDESISWGIPFYRYYGLLAGFACFREHVSFGFTVPFSSKELEDFREKGYGVGKKTIQIKFNQKVPAREIREILIKRARINRQKATKTIR